MVLSRFLAKQARKPSGFFGRYLTTRLLNKRNRDLENFGLKLMDLRVDDVVLEVGFGNGRFLCEMADIVIEGKLHGIDISKDMVDTARKKTASYTDQIELKQASVEDIPYPDDYFDKIFTANTVYFWPDCEKCIREIYRTIRKDGAFYCAFRLKEQMADHPIAGKNKDIFIHLFDEDDMINLLRNTGFSDVQIEKEEGDPYASYIAVAVK